VEEEPAWDGSSPRDRRESGLSDGGASGGAVLSRGKPPAAAVSAGGGYDAPRDAARDGHGGSPSEIQAPQTPPSLWAKRRSADSRDQESPCPGKKMPPERPERLQMLSLNHVSHAELQSPLDAFAAKHCPMRSRSSAESASTKSRSGGDGREGIPEVEFDLDEEHHRGNYDNTSPLSALIKRQFPQKGASERRLFE